jgi:hypothetical protein
MSIMTNPAAEITAIAERSQNATAAAVRTWMDTLKDYAASASPEHPFPRPADLQVAVNTYFDLAAKLLDEQRALVKVVVEAGTHLGDSLAEQVRTVSTAVPTAAARTGETAAASAQAAAAPVAEAKATEAAAETPAVIVPKSARASRTDKS